MLSYVASPISEARQSLKVGNEVEVYVSHSDSPSHFWCQLVKEEGLLQQLMDDLAMCYSGTQTNKPTVEEPLVGQLCAAK